MNKALIGALLGSALALAVAASPAAAAPQDHLESVAIASDSTSVGGGFHMAGGTTVGLYAFDIDASATWGGDVTTNVAWDDDDVRQGAEVDVSRSAPVTTGEIHVKWGIKGEVIPFLAPVPIPVDTTSQTVAACDVELGSGPGYTCSVTSDPITLIPAFGHPVYVKMKFEATFDVTPEGALVSRTASVAGDTAAGPDGLALQAAPEVETLAMPCSAQPGSAVDYALESVSWSPEVDAHQQAFLDIGASLSGVELPGVSVPGPTVDSNPEFELTASGFTASLGSLLENDVNPTIGTLGPFSGDEGSPVSFSADVDAACAIDSRVWEFSNGTTSYGPTPKRAFADDGEYDGQLTVTDETGRSAKRSFTVDVSNLAPVANAGPDTTADWGRPVQFNGQATDPGPADQATLEYTWWFGDGDDASGGASAVHEYAAPATRTAHFRACDNDNACDTDARTVLVTKRDTTLGYTGPLAESSSKTVTLTAHLEDEYGQPVASRKITFQLGAQSAVGTTDGSGNASVSLKLDQKKGAYPLSATFPAGDSKYNDSVDLGEFVIGK